MSIIKESLIMTLKQIETLKNKIKTYKNFFHNRANTKGDL